MDEESLKKLKVAELKELLQAKGLPVAGKKEELIQRFLTESKPEVESEEVGKVVFSSQPSPSTVSKPAIDKIIKQGNDRKNENSSSEETVTIKSSQSRNALAMKLSLDEVERIKARQARFGTTAPILQELEQARKLEERRQRFTNH